MNERIEHIRTRLRKLISPGAKDFEVEAAKLLEELREAMRDTLEDRDRRQIISYHKNLRAILGGPPTGPTRPRIDRDGMPPPLAFFIGRNDEISKLTEWIARPTSRIAQVVGVGGAGKTQLVNQWLLELQEPEKMPSGARMRAIFCWCFYRTPGRTPVAVSEFLREAVNFFRQVNPDVPVSTDDERDLAGELAARASFNDCLIVLDGFEHLQKKHLDADTDEDGVEPGAIAERAAQMATFLSRMSKAEAGKVCVTSRQSLAIDERIFTINHIELTGMTKAEGVQSLRRFAIQGSDQELEAIVEGLSGHPLSLGLAGAALAQGYESLAYFWRPVRLVGPNPDDSPPELERQIVDSYKKWLGNGKEMELLRLLGFFSKRHVAREDLERLIGVDELKPIVPRLKAAISSQSGPVSSEWEPVYATLQRLRDYNLLLEGYEKSKELLEGGVLTYDAHPLLRDHFRVSLKALEEGRYWQLGNEKLFESYTSKVQGEASSEQDASALYEAIGYACEAGRFREAYEIYWRRIHHNRDNENPRWYGLGTLGLIDRDLGALGWFFERPWQKLRKGVEDKLKEYELLMLRFAASKSLQTLGLLVEAGHPLNSVRQSIGGRDEYLLHQAILAGQESERKLVRGQLDVAEERAKEALAFARRARNNRQIVSKLARLADTQVHAGKWLEAKKGFEEVIHTHRETSENPDDPVGGMTGFLYGQFRLNAAELALSSPAAEAGATLVCPTRQAAEELVQAVRLEVDRFRATKRHDSQDLALHDFLGLRGESIANVRSPEPSLDRQKVLDERFDELEDRFRRYARMELPRLLVRRSKVLRGCFRLGDRRTKYLETAAEILDEASQLAEAGGMKLFEADVKVERAKLLSSLEEVPGGWLPPGMTGTSTEALAEAHAFAEELGYGLRLSEIALADPSL